MEKKHVASEIFTCFAECVFAHVRVCKIVCLYVSPCEFGSPCTYEYMHLFVSMCVGERDYQDKVVFYVNPAGTQVSDG